MKSARSFVNVSWQYVAYPIAIALVLVLAWTLVDRGNYSLTSDVASETTKRVIGTVASSTDGRNADLTGLRKDEADLQRVGAYFDRSLSMQPYLTTRENSDFYRLINRLGNFIDSETTLHGFGFKSASDERQTVSKITTVELKQPSTYIYKNNDYGSLLDRLSKGETTNLIVTDGVQSDPETGAQLGKVLEAIDRWVRTGGTFATLLHRTPYSGQYYSDLPGAEPQYACPDRPLTTFALGRSPSAVDDLLGRFGEGLQPDHVVRLGKNPLPIAPVQRAVAEGGRRGKRVFRETDEYVLDRFDQVYRAPVVQAAAGPDDFVPLQFRASIDMSAFPWKALGDEEIKFFLKNLEPHVEAFALNRSVVEKLNQANPRRRASLFPTQSREADSLDLLKPTPIQVREMPDPVIDIESDTARVQFALPVRRPETGPQTSQFAFLVRLGVNAEGARMLVPDSYTTRNDLDPANCDKILNLQQLVATIMHRNYAPGQMLLLSEWR